MLNKNRTQGWLCQKTEEQRKAEDREVVSLLRKGVFHSGCGEVDIKNIKL